MNPAVKMTVCWYEPDEWESLKQIAADKDTLDDTYEEWKTGADKTIGELRAQGQQVQKVSMKIDRLTAWCEENGLENTSKSRSRYAVEYSRQRQSTLKA